MLPVMEKFSILWPFLFISYCIKRRFNKYICPARMSSKRKQSNFFDSLQRAQTDNMADAKTPNRKRREGKSEFLKSKFDQDYDPKYRVFKIGNSHYEQKNSPKNNKSEELTDLVSKAQEEIRKGRKLIIDWSAQNNFRTTRFPSLDQNLSLSRRVNTEEIIISKLDSPKKAKYYEYLDKFEKKPSFKEIVDRGQHLRSLISESILEKRKKQRKYTLKAKNFKSDLSTQLEPNSPNEATVKIDPHFNYSIIEDVEQKQKEFFEKNSKKIQQAMDCERSLAEPIHEKVQKKKLKIQEIHERILCKSKLTLLKSDLIRKFKEIKEGILDDSHNMQRHRLSLH